MTEPELFPDVPRIEPEPEPEPMSYGQRLTIRRREMLAKGIHPTSRRPLLAPGHPNHGTTCGHCVHAFRHMAAKGYWKCEKAAGGLTHGPASDVRVSWPACELWDPIGDTE